MAQPIILLAGGGSGGHLYPGISVAQSLVDFAPQYKSVVLCTTRLIDRAILEPTGLAFIQQPIVPPRKSVGGLLRFWRNWRATQELVEKQLKENDVKAVLGLGGYAAGVAVKLAAKAGIPTAMLNPDVIPGKANQYLLKSVRRVFCMFEETASQVAATQRDKLVVTGCPIRREILDLPSRTDAAKRLQLDPLLHTLMVTGASQGAVTVNEGVCETLRLLLANNPQRAMQGWQILHLAGKDNAVGVRKEYREMNLPATVLEFTPDMADVWAVTDLAVSRAGASTCAELVALGIPSVLMPYPYHKDMHQLANAQALERVGAAVVVDDAKDRKINAHRLLPILESLLFDASARSHLATSAKTLGKPAAADAIARELLTMIA